MLRAVIFDCDGVLADTEPLHLRAFNLVLEPLGFSMSSADYADDYLGLDDREAFARALSSRNHHASADEVDRLVTAKAQLFITVLRAECRIYPGVVTFVRALDGMSRAVASGARREEIATVLRRAALTDAFPVVVGTEDVTAGKPDPAPFLTALAELNRAGGTITPDECLVIEDSLHGLTAARRAGMRCLAVTNSYPGTALVGADLVVQSLEDVSLVVVQDLFAC